MITQHTVSPIFHNLHLCGTFTAECTDICSWLLTKFILDTEDQLLCSILTGFGKCKMSCSYHYSITQKSFTTLLFWNLMDCSPPGSSVHRISQASILAWVPVSFSMGSSWLREWKWKCLLHWQVNSLPLSHQGNPHAFYCIKFKATSKTLPALSS